MVFRYEILFFSVLYNTKLSLAIASQVFLLLSFSKTPSKQFWSLSLAYPHLTAISYIFFSVLPPRARFCVYFPVPFSYHFKISSLTAFSFELILFIFFYNSAFHFQGFYLVFFHMLLLWFFIIFIFSRLLSFLLSLCKILLKSQTHLF